MRFRGTRLRDRDSRRNRERQRTRRPRKWWESRCGRKGEERWGPKPRRLASERTVGPTAEKAAWFASQTKARAAKGRMNKRNEWLRVQGVAARWFGISRYARLYLCLARITWTRWKKRRRRRRRRWRRRSVPEIPPMRIFSSVARASLRDSHAIDLFPYRRLISMSACGSFLPFFLLLSSFSRACHELRNLGPITRR